MAFDVDVVETNGGDGLTLTANGQVPFTVLGAVTQALGVSDDAFNIQVTSSAQLGEVQVEAESQTGAACILLMDPVRHSSFLVNSGAKLDAPNCEIHVKSNSNQATMYNSGQRITTQRVCMEGTMQNNNVRNDPNAAPNTVEDCRTTNDPFAGNLPLPPAYSNCQRLQPIQGYRIMWPGCYSGDVNFQNNPEIWLMPGVYVIDNGTWNISGGKFRGTGVTIYLKGRGRVNFQNNVQIDLRAPIFGTYKGILLYEDVNRPGYGETFDFNTSDLFLEGLIYLPTRRGQINSGNTLRAYKMTMVWHSLILNNVNWTLEPAELSIPTNATSTTTTKISAPILVAQ